MGAAPEALAKSKAAKPMGPAPAINTGLPNCKPAALMPWLNSDSVVDSDVGHTFSHSNDATCGLVAQGTVSQNFELTNGSSFPEMDIGAADTSGLNMKQHLAGARLPHRGFDHLQAVVGSNLKRGILFECHSKTSSVLHDGSGTYLRHSQRRNQECVGQTEVMKRLAI